MKSNELTLYAILFSILIIMGWMFIVFQPVRSQIRHAEAMINRATDRIEKRTKLPDAPTVSAAKLRDMMDSLTAERDLLKAGIASREAHFVSLRTVSGIRELRLTIASLAEAAGLKVIRFGELDPDEQDVNSIQALASLIREPYGRPVLNFEAVGGYADVSRFVESMGKLEKSVAITRMSIKAPEYRIMMSDPNAAERLSINMDFAL